MTLFDNLILAAGLLATANAQADTRPSSTVEVNSGTSTASATSAPSCSSTIDPQNGQPSVLDGWSARVIANELTDPRGIIFDSEGHMLVVQQARGIAVMNLTGDGPCVSAGEPTEIIADESLNHGIEFSADGRTLYASGPSAVYAWDYDPSQGRNTSGPRMVIENMGDPDGHVTRTLLMSRQVPGMLMVSRGSQGNLDYSALDVSTGVSTIKAFNMSNVTDQAYDFPSEGLLLGWGLRNSVGVAEDPITGAIYSVENSVDNFNRSGENIHQNNPGEEMNFHGYLNGTETSEQGQNYGYPSCFAAWDIDSIPNNDGLEVGTNFAIGEQNSTLNDTFCQEERIAPRLTFQAHMAPLDMKFNTNATAAWISFHGSWNREEPIGYKLSVVGFDNGEPTADADSNTSTTDVVWNSDLSRCPDECFRPVGLAWDSQGRLFMSSDSTGEIYVVTRNEGEDGSADDASPTSGIPTQQASGSGTAPSSTGTEGAATNLHGGNKQFAALLAGIMAIPLM